MVFIYKEGLKMNNLTKNLIMLNMILGPNNNLIEKIEDFFGQDELQNIHLYLSELKESNLIEAKKVDELTKFIKENRMDFFEEYLNKENIFTLTKYDFNYPEKLRYIENQPFILYIKGNLDSLINKRKSLAVIGSRKATAYGKWATEKFVSELSFNKFNIISGMANGIDTFAHNEALKCNNYTVAVLGCGVDIIYPPRNKTLYSKIVESGAVISEFPLGTIPMPYNFPVRNRIISGLSDGILVIEASEKSGTLITATHGAEQGKEIFAIPGNIDNIYSRGTNKLIREGAKVTTCIEDILEEFSLEISIDATNYVDFSSFSKTQIDIINYLKTGEKTILQLKDFTNHTISELYSCLTMLEMQGIIKQEQGKKFRMQILF